MITRLEAGVAYRLFRGRIGLAIDHERVLVMSPRGTEIRDRPRVKEALRTMSVADLAREWGVTPENIDSVITPRFFAASPDGIDRRRSTGPTRRDSDEAIALGQALRTHRLHR